MRNPSVGDRVQILRVPGVADLDLATRLREPQVIERIDGESIYVEGWDYAVRAEDLAVAPMQRFEDVEHIIRSLPMTWKPAVLKLLVETCGDAINCPVQFVEGVVTEQTRREKEAKRGG